MSDPQKPLSMLSAVDALVERWFFETFHGSLIAQSTGVWNTVHAAKDDLKRRLSAFLSEQPQS